MDRILPRMVTGDRWAYPGTKSNKRSHRDHRGGSHHPLSASEAPWTKAINAEGAYVTDAPFLYRAKNNDLLMIWSGGTSKNNHYAIGVARSQSGKIEGPWVHEEETLNNFSGGHAMIFEDLEGVLRIAFHSPNSGDMERAVIYELIDLNGRISLGNKLE